MEYSFSASEGQRKDPQFDGKPPDRSIVRVVHEESREVPVALGISAMATTKTDPRVREEIFLVSPLM